MTAPTPKINKGALPATVELYSMNLNQVSMEASLARLRAACEEVYELHVQAAAKRNAIAGAALQACTQLRNLATALEKRDEMVPAGFARRTAAELQTALEAK